ncbi:MAG: LUD domain-containing protein, partial [Alphaproteobacteria bacterium]|nr:LUD domain-containing protein [Alphaproteobacteria bacterium]
REEILSAIIRARPTKVAPAPLPYVAPAHGDPLQAFADRATRANADVRFVTSEAEIPLVIAELLRARNLPAAIHVPPNATQVPWDSAPGLTLEQSAPGPEDAAVAIAPFGIAETGTLAYPARADAPASWHFRAGFEIAVLRATDVLPHMEDVLARLKARELPSTLNFVTGPSRTGDIEQTLELGAHGPKALAILIVRN